MMTLPVRRNGDTTTSWDPLAEIDRLNRQLQGYLDSWKTFPSMLGDGFTPLADVEETDEAYQVEIELPGVKKGDVDIEVAGRRLTVSGERKEKERVGILRRRTRSVGRFYYEVVLPGEVDEDAIHASLDEGVLTVTVPKAASDRPRRIRIS
jgi:HSP20 family protein